MREICLRTGAKVFDEKYNRHVCEAAAAGVGARCVLCVAKRESLVEFGGRPCDVD